MPGEISDFASVELLAPDLQLDSLRTDQPKYRRLAARAVADRYEEQHRQQPSAACLIKAQWALAMRPGQPHACQPPEEARGLPAAALVGVYFGLYFNPIKDSVHKRLGRTLQDILSEAPANARSLLFMQVRELLTQLRSHGTTVVERAAIYGTTQDVRDLIAWVQAIDHGKPGDEAELARDCVQMGLDALLEFCRAEVAALNYKQVQWSINARNLIDAGAGLRTLDQRNTLTMLALLGDGTGLLERLPEGVYAPGKVFGLGAKQLTLTQWVLDEEPIPARSDKLQFVVRQSVDPLTYPAHTVSPWVLGFARECNAEYTQVLAQCPQRVNRADPHTGERALHLLARQAHSGRKWESLAALLLAGADPQARDSCGETALEVLRASDYGVDLRHFVPWLALTREAIEGFADRIQTQPHQALAVFLQSKRCEHAHEALWLLRYHEHLHHAAQPARRYDGAQNLLKWTADVLRWLHVDTETELRERRATLQRACNAKIVEAIVQCKRQLAGGEWRLLRIVLGHVARYPKCGKLSTLVQETMDDVCRARAKGKAYRQGLAEALCDFRKLPLDIFCTWSSGDSRPPVYATLLRMQQLNYDYPDMHLSSAMARWIVQDGSEDVSGFDVQVVDAHIRRVCGRAGHYSTLEAALADSSINAKPLSNDVETAEALVALEPAALPSAAVTEAAPLPPVPTPACAPATVQLPADAPTPSPPLAAAPAPALAAPQGHSLLPVVSKGIEPLLNDLEHGRLNEGDLEPLRSIAEMARQDPTFLRGPEPFLMVELRGLQEAAQATDAAAVQGVGEKALARVCLLHKAMHNELLQEVMLGTAGIGENERLQRAARRLVARSFVQLLACSLGDSFALTFLGDDAAARARDMRSVASRVSPNRSCWAGQPPAVLEPLTGLFQFVNGFKSLHANTPQLGRTLGALLKGSGGRA